MYVIQKPATENSCEGLQISCSEHMLLIDHVSHHVITTMQVTRAVNHIPILRNTYLKYYGWEVVKMFSV